MWVVIRFPEYVRSKYLEATKTFSILSLADVEDHFVINTNTSRRENDFSTAAEYSESGN